MANTNKPPATTVAGVQQEEAAKEASAKEAADKLKADALALLEATKPKTPSRLDALIAQKLAAGLSHQMATECAKAQIAEDESGIYDKVRNEISGITPKKPAKA